MANLGNYAATQAVLYKYGFRTRKKYGQNFLIDASVLERIAEAAGLAKEDHVLEIGPGIGTLTQVLAEKAADVTAVEIDDWLIPILGETLADYPNADVEHMDFMEYDVAKWDASLTDGPRKAVANLPYYITTPVLMKLLTCGVRFENMLFMVQKEVAERILAAPGTKDYGALSLAAAYYAKVENVGTVSRACFLPSPAVESALLRLTMYEEPPVKVNDPEQMFRVIRASFNQRRKTLVNGIANFEGFSFTREEASKALETIGLPAAVRGETLTLAQFAELSDALGGLAKEQKEL